MDTIVLFAAACASSLTLWLVGRRRLRLEPAALVAAIANAVELLGAAMLFWAGNVALCSALALLIRGLRLRFVSLYLGGDVMLPVVALLQALAFEAWRRHSRASS
jgi:hypothetical protein